MSNTIDEVVCLIPNSSMTDLTGRLWNYRNGGGISFFESGGVFDQPYIRFTDATLYRNYLYTRTIEDNNQDFRLGQDFTVEFWVRNIDNPSKEWCYFITYHPDNSTGTGWAVGYNASIKKLHWHNSQGGIQITSNTLVTGMTDWTHVAFVKSKKRMAVFVNGMRETIKDNISNDYLVDTNIKDGLYIGRHNSTWNGSDTQFTGDFGGLKISKYARYDIDSETVDVKDFILDTPQNNYNNINIRKDRLNLFLEMNAPEFGDFKGLVWRNYRDRVVHTNIDTVTTFQPYYIYDINDNSVKATSKKSSDVSVNFDRFGSIINNVDQDWMVQWDLYIAPEWCNLSINPPSKKMNFVWESPQIPDVQKVMLWYGRDANSSTRSFFSIGNSSYTAEPSEANRRYFDFKFEPNVRYKCAMSYKNHTMNFYINGKLFYSRNHSAIYLFYSNDHYSDKSNFTIGGADVNNEINYCEKLDNIFIMVGKAVNSETYDYDNDEFDYDWNKNNDIEKYGDTKLIIEKDYKPELMYSTQRSNKVLTNLIVDTINDTRAYRILDVNDVRKVIPYKIYLEGKNNKLEYVNILTKNLSTSHYFPTKESINNVVTFDYNNIKFIHNDELIVQEKDYRVVLGYLTGEVEQTVCKTKSLFIKIFNHRTNRCVGEYEIIDGVFTADNLNYYDLYDVLLVDREDELETQIMSKRRPTPYRIEDTLIQYNTKNIFGEILNAELFIKVKVNSVVDFDFTKVSSLPSEFNLTRSSIATYINSDGVMVDAAVNEPRFDHRYDKTSNSMINNGLLVEVASTNILFNGRNFSGWNMNVSTSVTNDTSIKRIDNTDSLKTVFTASGGAGYYNVGTSVTSSQYYTVSVLLNTTYSTPNDSLKVNLGHYQLGGEATVVNFSNNTVSNNSLIQNSGFINITKDWERGYYTVISSGSSNASMVFYNGDNLNKTVYHDLYQVENLPYATSFIKTTGSIASRSKDNLTVVDNTRYTGTVIYQYINQSEPNMVKISLLDHVDSVLIPTPPEFVSGWIRSISVLEKILDQPEKNDLKYALEQSLNQ